MSDDQKPTDKPVVPANAEKKPESATPAESASAAATPVPEAPAPKKTKPAPLTPEQIAEQISSFQIEKDTLTGTYKTLKAQLTKIETAVKENDTLRAKITHQTAESYSHFLVEWKRKSDFFPEVRLQMILKAVEILTPKKK